MIDHMHIEPAGRIGDERRNTRAGNQAREVRLLGMRTHRMRTMTHEIDRLSSTLRTKPGVLGRLEQALANANDEIDRALKVAHKFANRPDGRSAITRSCDSAELRSIENGGNG